MRENSEVDDWGRGREGQSNAGSYSARQGKSFLLHTYNKHDKTFTNQVNFSYGKFVQSL